MILKCLVTGHSRLQGIFFVLTLSKRNTNHYNWLGKVERFIESQ